MSEGAPYGPDLAGQAELLRRLTNLRQAPGRSAMAGMRAPHKPLLLVVLLSRVSKGAPRVFRFQEIAAEFLQLWSTFGWNERTDAANPWVYLVGDGFWELLGSDGAPLTQRLKSVSRGIVEARGPFGRFTDRAWHLLLDDAFRSRCLAALLDRYFPPFQRSELVDATGISLDQQPAFPAILREVTIVTRRDSRQQAEFRTRILTAYEGCCAVCGFSATGARAPSPVEAAHVWPVEYDGPSIPRNGVALCRLHHWALDSGTIGVGPDLTVHVSSRVTNGDALNRLIRFYHGGRLRPPRTGVEPPHREWTERHYLARFLAPAIGEPATA